MRKIINLYKKYNEIINYVIVGALTTLVSLSSYFICVTFFLDAKNAFELQLSNIISWILSVTFAYFANRIYVFKSKNKNKLKEAIKFYSSRITTLLIDMGVMFLLVTVLSFNDKISKIIVQFVILILNYLFSKFIVFKKEKSVKKVIFISSTGGHLSELLQLRPLMDEYDSYLITEKTKSNISLKNKFNNVHYLIYGTKKHIFRYIFRFSLNILISLYYFIKIRPSVIITTGTHTAVPMCYIGKLFGSKIIYIETFANSKTKTMAGKIVYPIADTFIVQWESMLKLYPKAILGGWIY